MVDLLIEKGKDLTGGDIESNVIPELGAPPPTLGDFSMAGPDRQRIVVSFAGHVIGEGFNSDTVRSHVVDAGRTFPEGDR
jgi:hypothetical protein